MPVFRKILKYLEVKGKSNIQISCLLSKYLQPPWKNHSHRCSGCTDSAASGSKGVSTCPWASPLHFSRAKCWSVQLLPSVFLDPVSYIIVLPPTSAIRPQTCHTRKFHLVTTTRSCLSSSLPYVPSSTPESPEPDDNAEDGKCGTAMACAPC